MRRSKLPQEPWPQGFGGSRLESLYTRELYWLAHQIEEKCNQLFSRHPSNPASYYAATDTDSLDLAFQVLADASRFRELLYPGKVKLIYDQRASHLRGLLSGVDYSALIDKQVRNTLEHFPEYLDDANYIHSCVPPTKRYAVAFNFVFSHLYELEPGDLPFPAFLSPLDGLSVFPIRVYVASSRKVHNFFWSIDLGLLAQQATGVKIAISGMLGETKPEAWISGLITIGPT